jgi:hypothetical protein
MKIWSENLFIYIMTLLAAAMVAVAIYYAVS